jgi:hypothetical protein
MPNSRVRVRAWCEDRGHERFVRDVLKHRYNLGRRDVDVKPAPRGLGSASQWVIAAYPEVVRQMRAARKQANLGFLVVVDGDSVGLVARLRSLCGQPNRRASTDRLAIWVPTWNIETWVLWLCGCQVKGHNVDEQSSYKGSIKQSDFGSLSAQAAAKWEPPLQAEPTSVPSLAAARVELTLLPLP